jgi:hypothetical protein
MWSVKDLFWVHLDYVYFRGKVPLPGRGLEARGGTSMA